MNFKDPSLQFFYDYEQIIDKITPYPEEYDTILASSALDACSSVGRSWQGESVCKYGFISLPYLDGPDLEDFRFKGNLIKFYWLIPLTEKEVDYKKVYGSDHLEQLFEEKQLDYLNPHRSSLV